MEIIIGKYTLESLTTGMYKDPFILYREYIQNCTDSIDEATQKGILGKNEGCIKIIVNDKDREIIIEDNGMGIENSKAYKILTDIGNSKKKSSTHKGFRGIGRLGGLSYCEKLVFETSFYNEDTKTIIEFDSNLLKEILMPGKYEDYTMIDVIKNITSESIEKEEKNKHYFRVILKGVSNRYKLLDFERVENYLSQVAPIPFNKKFALGNKINSELENLNLENNEYNILLGIEKNEMNQIFKPYNTKFYADINKKIEDTIEDAKFKVIIDDYKKKIIAFVWYGESNLFGTIVDEKIKGLRVRKSGILIGDRFLLNDIFKEERFNGWIQGEVLVYDDKIIPNARRDDFEKNDEYLFLIEELKKIANEINSDIRGISSIRNQKKTNVVEQITIDNIKANDDKKADENIKENASFDDNFEMLFDKFENQDNEKSILEKIKDILNEELSEEKSEEIMAKISKLF